MAVTKSAPKKVVVSAGARRGANPDPKWADWEKMSGAEYHKFRRMAAQYYYQEYKTADLLPDLYAWMKENKYSVEDIRLVKAVGSFNLTQAAIIARCLRTGMPDFNEKEAAHWAELEGTMGDLKPVSIFVKERIVEAIERGKTIKEPEEAKAADAPPAFQPSIQDRLREAAYKMTDEIEDAHDEFLKDPEAFDPKAIKMVNLLKGKECKGAHARIIKDFYQRPYSEILEVMAGKDEQLNEGYSCYTKKQIKKLHDFYSEIISACDMLQQEGKVNRKPRVKKPVAKDKLVAKMKYCKSDDATKMVSVNPADIIGSQELWVYNIKTRKLGKYVAAQYGELRVKGTTVIGFDENKSVQKTLRKPVEQLKEFKSAGKVTLRKFLDDIKAVDIKLNGRINEDTILLKVS
jgi:hypothetical protein